MSNVPKTDLLRDKDKNPPIILNRKGVKTYDNNTSNYDRGFVWACLDRGNKDYGYAEVSKGNKKRYVRNV